MATASIVKTAVAQGKTFSYALTVSSDGAMVKDPSLAAAKTGTLTTRTSDTAGTLTMDSGHGITNGAKIDIYWSTGQATSATVGTVATNSVPFTGATGPALPAAATAVTVMVQQSEAFAVLDANLEALFVGAGGVACSATFKDASNNVIGVVRVNAAASGATNYKDYIWDDGDGSDIPVSDDIATVHLSHGDSSSARQVNVVAMVN
jgi:hypothetical protein